MKLKPLFLFALFLMFSPVDVNCDGRIEWNEIFHKPRFGWTALSMLRSKTKREKEAIAAVPVTTLVPDGFKGLAGSCGMTPEYLASLALIKFMESAPKNLNVISASPLNEQDCATCPLRANCSSADQRGEKICFEKLVG